MVCPNEIACGDMGNKFITPPLSGEVITRDIDRYNYNSQFVLDDVCSFIIKNPENMGVKDWMWLHAYNAENALVHVMQLYNYRHNGRNPSFVGVNGKKFGMLRGKDYYVAGISNSVFPGWFRIKTWVVRYIPPPDYTPPVFEQPIVRPPEPTPTPEPIEEEQVEEQPTPTPDSPEQQPDQEETPSEESTEAEEQLVEEVEEEEDSTDTVVEEDEDEDLEEPNANDEPVYYIPPDGIIIPKPTVEEEE